MGTNLAATSLLHKLFLSNTQLMPEATQTPSTTPPAARRGAASAKSEQRIRDILRVGREVFAEKGYEHATTIEIAQRLGISEATVFTYFRGKRELCVRVIGDWYDEIIGAMAAALPADGTARAQLAVFMHTHLRLFLIQGTGLCALVLSEGRSKGPGLGDAIKPLQRRYTVALMDLLARGQQAGEIRTDMPLRLMRTMVLGPMEHVLWEAVAQDKPIDSERTAEALVQMVWAAISAGDTEVQQLRQLRSDLQGALARAG